MSNVIPERPLEDFNAGYHLQQAVCDALLSSEQLSSLGIVPLAEDQRHIEFEIKNALQKQGLALVVQTPRLTQIGHNGASICWQADDLTLLITEYVPTNRAGNRAQFTTGLELATFCQEYLAGPQGAVEFGKLCPKAIEQGEESGLLVTKCTFDTTILTDFNGSFEPISGHVVISPYAHQADLETLSSDVIGNTLDISEISSRLSSLPSDVSALSSQVSSNALSIAEHEIQISSSRAEINSLGQSVSSIGAQLSSKAEKTQLAEYMPLSGGPVDDDCAIWGERVSFTTFDGDATTSYCAGYMATSTTILNMPRTSADEETLATEEWTGARLSGKADLSVIGDINGILDQLNGEMA